MSQTRKAKSNQDIASNLFLIPENLFSKIKSTLDVIGALIMMQNWTVALRNYQKMPDEVPIHYNIYGIADNYGTKDWIFCFAGVNTLIFIIFELCLRFPNIKDFLEKFKWNPFKKHINEHWVPWLLRLTMLNKQACLLYVTDVTIYNSINENNTIELMKIFIFVIIEILLIGLFMLLSINKHKKNE